METVNMDSILESIKKCSGLPAWDDAFDSDLILFINSNLLNLKQIGVSIPDEFSVVDSDTLWSDMNLSNSMLLLTIKSWLYLKTRMEFDPPTGSAADSFKEMIKEHEWRINSEVDFK